MLDINFIRENTEKVKKGTMAKGCDVGLVDQALKLDEKRRSLIERVEKLRAKRNKIAESMSPSPSPSEDESETLRNQIINEGRMVRDEIQKFEPELKIAEEQLKNILCQIPNPPADDVKTGKDETENEIIKKWGTIPQFKFKARDHLEIGQNLDIIDVDRAGKVSGARFGYLKNEAVVLEFALIQLALNTLIKKGFTPIIPPVLMKVPVFHQLGYSEHMGNENYYLAKGGDPAKTQGEEESEYYLVGTAEHSIVPYYKNEVIKEKDLPKRFVGFSTAFRREAGSYGKDTRGILRVHQFDKVEMVSFTKIEESDKEHKFLLSLEEYLFQALEIPYQVSKMCSGDLGAPAARKYDIEAWMPGQGKYREVTSTSTCTDFQARRLNIRYKDNTLSAVPGDATPGQMMPGIGPITRYVHTLNGTAFAIGRTIIAILENYQQKDGSVLVPKVLQKYCGFEKISPRK